MDILPSLSSPIGYDLPIWLVAVCTFGISLWWILYHPWPRLLDVIYLYDWSLSVRSESHYDGYFTIFCLSYWMWSTYMIGRCLYVRNLTMMDILPSFVSPIGCDLPIWLISNGTFRSLYKIFKTMPSVLRASKRNITRRNKTSLKIEDVRSNKPERQFIYIYICYIMKWWPSCL